MQLVKEEVLNLMRNNRQTRVSIILNPKMIRGETEFTTDIEYDYLYFQGGVIDNLAATDEKREYNIANETIQERLQNYNQRGSNWRFNRVDFLDIYIGEYKPLRGSS